MSAGIFLPDSRMVSVPAGCFCTSRTVSQNRNVTARSRSWYCSASTISLSQKSSIARPLLDDGDLGAERGEHRRVLDADHAGADHHHRGRHLVHAQDLIGVDDRLAVEVDGRRPRRLGADRDDDLVGAELVLVAVVVDDDDRVRVDELRGADEQRDVVARELVADDVDLPVDHMRRPGGQVGDRDVLLDPVGLAVQLALGQAGQVEHRLAQRLGRDGAGVDADAAHHVAAFDDRGPMAQLRRGDRRLLAGRSGTDDDHVVRVHARDPSITSAPRRC